MTSHREGRSIGWGRIIGAVVAVLVVAALAVWVARSHGVRPHLGSASPPPAHAPAEKIAGADAGPLGDSPSPTPSATHSSAAAPDVCRSNPVAQHVFVSIRQQHAWVCAGRREVYTTAVTTGAAADGNGTPTGTWHVQAKQTNRWLTVLDGSTYHVDYWMPYDGAYGFHDAVWQTFAFGGRQYRTDGSHGCVHFPMTAMKWIFRWAAVGAAVTINA